MLLLYDNKSEDEEEDMVPRSQEEVSLTSPGSQKDPKAKLEDLSDINLIVAGQNKKFGIVYSLPSFWGKTEKLERDMSFVSRKLLKIWRSMKT